MQNGVNEAVPQHLVSLIRNYERKEQPQQAVASVRPVHREAQTSFLQRVADLLLPSPGAMAAAAGALVVGIAIGTVMNSDAFAPAPAASPQLVGWHAPDSALGTLLQGSASGAWVAVAQNDPSATFKGVLSFRTKDGAYCRQYSIRRAGVDAVQGVACRNPTRGWRDVIRVAVKAGASGGIKAAAESAAPHQIDSTVDSMIAGDYLGPKQEEQLIGQGWRQ